MSFSGLYLTRVWLGSNFTPKFLPAKIRPLAAHVKLTENCQAKCISCDYWKTRWHDGIKADRAVAEKIPVLDRLMTPEFRARRPDMAFLFRQMGTFNTAKMQDLTNLNSDGPSVEELAAAPFPLLLLAGEKDAVLSPSTVRRAGEVLPSARVEIVPGAPHSMYWEAPDLFNDAMKKILADFYA